MRKGFYYISICFAAFLLWSCSTKKNTKATRFYHAFNSRYNIYFNGKTAFDCAKQGDAAAIKVVSDYVKYLSESLMSMMNIFRPDIIILGGGVSGQGAYLIDKIHAYCEKFHYGYKGGPKPVIKCAELGNDAGIIGAAALLNQ